MLGTDEFANRLNDHLDRLAHGNERAVPFLDATTVESVDLFFARDDAPPPPPGLADQVWETVMRQAARTIPNATTSPSVLFSVSNGRLTGSHRPPIPVSNWTDPASRRSGQASDTSANVAFLGRSRWRTGFAHAATAVLLMLTLGLGYLALATSSDPEPDAHTSGAVIAAPTHPLVDLAGAESLLSLTLPPEHLPQTSEQRVSLVDIVIQPGTSGQWLGTSDSCCPGVRVDYVVEGAYTVRADGPLAVRWADGREETVPTGTEIVLGAGDRMIVPEGTGFTNANAGTSPVRLLGWYLYSGGAKSLRSAANWMLSGVESVGSKEPLQSHSGAVRLELRRGRLAPGVMVPPSSGSAQFVVSLDRMAILGEQSDGSIRNVGKAEITVYILTATPTASGSAVDSSGDGTLQSAQSGVDEEAFLLSLTLQTEGVPPDVWKEARPVNVVIPPGTEGSWPGVDRPCCTGVRVDYVAEGSVTVQADEPLQVVWADGKLETITAGTAIELGPGDTLITRRGMVFTHAKAGDVPVRLLGWILPVGSNWKAQSADTQGTDPLARQQQAVSLHLRQVEVPAGGTVPTSTDALQVAVGLDPRAMLGEQSDGTMRNVGNAPVTVYILTMEPAGPVSPAETEG